MDDQDRFIDDTTSEEDEDMDFTGEHEIHTKEGYPEVKSLYEQWEGGRLDIQPEFQRNFVWDIKKCSRLIESAMLGIPLPTIYLSQEQNGKELVIDGQQRLAAFFYFKRGELPKNRKFKLGHLEVLKTLNGQQYKDLDIENQEKIDRCSLRVIRFLKNSDPNIRFEIFQRLNSGSVPLNDQEMRNCVYRGPYNTLLRKLSENEDFRKIMGFNGADSRMRDIERVLRFASFYSQGYLQNYKEPMKKFMNDEIRSRRYISDIEAQKLESEFRNAVYCVRTVFGTNAFRKWSFVDGDINHQIKQDRTFNASLYDILMGEFVKRDRIAITKNADSIREALIDLSVSDDKFIESIAGPTSSKKNVRARFDIWRKTLDDILAHQEKQPRCFSHALKKELFDKDPTCQICGQRIMDIKDAAVDHIEQYWLGGKTIPENARLTHRHCNNKRRRRE